MIDKPLSLFELNKIVQTVVKDTLHRLFWVEAELASVNESRGHLYMELIQKQDCSNTPVARASAKCWANVWSSIKQEFHRTTGNTLHAGMKVMLQVYPNFHPAFGFSWIVTAIDANYSLGEMVRRRMEIIQQLRTEGVFDLQRQIPLPRFCQHIAVISSASAAGYGDFCSHLSDNPYGFVFQTELFVATMQGEQVEASIISQLDLIYSQIDEGKAFDCVVIIRGGGSVSDLSGFDSLLLGESVANFPIPIITGIGHDRDESIVDMVSHIHVKTPTAAATFLIENLLGVLEFIEESCNKIRNVGSQRLEKEKMRLELITQQIPFIINNRIQSERHNLELYLQKIKAADPRAILSRGYSMTLHEGRIVSDVRKLQQGNVIETILADGTISSMVL